MKTIKNFILYAFLLLTSIGFAQETITNESVIQMVELGFDDYMIIDKINTSDVKFDASISALGEMKNAGVSSEILSLIMDKSKQNTKSKTGIYYTDANGEDKLVQPSVFSGSNSNAVAQKLVSGLINSKQKAQLPKTQSNNVIRQSQPEFTFIFDPSVTEVDNMQNNQGSDAGIFNWWFRMASNPNEFVLVKLTVKEKKNLREVVTGKSSWITSSSGIDPKYALNFSIEEIEGNKFKVTPDTLEPGEYCFIYQGQVPQGRENQSVFDFSIQ
ncbi:hypothetical protein Q2T41_05100 [Maribacter confluentis]|uniref:Uncharacterized protein n=2 Tax=Maribacter TaxID=252356 RepID=A0ABY1SLI0_9FLAO|nr:MULTISPECIES: hypothetical protein [Maribacter]MDO1512040.1 hypothetical protein [Maribacter confluentis]TVZ15306.1 hypothetical protein JM81_1533 [Maribacter sp. MAR_2009_72]SNR72941.1 hypothetical protein SAMN04488009_3461 [Maribacter sedimenticola]